MVGLQKYVHSTCAGVSAKYMRTDARVQPLVVCLCYTTPVRDGWAYLVFAVCDTVLLYKSKLTN